MLEHAHECPRVPTNARRYTETPERRQEKARNTRARLVVLEIVHKAAHAGEIVHARRSSPTTSDE